MVTQSQSVQGAILAAGSAALVASITYLHPPELYGGLTLGLFLILGVPSLVYASSRMRRAQNEGSGFFPTMSYAEVREIQENLPTIRDDTYELAGNMITGYQAVVKFTIRNNRTIIFDDMSASAEVTNLDLNKRSIRWFKLPDLGPREYQPHRFKVPIGRRLPRNYKTIVIITRNGIEVGRLHYTFS